MTNEQAIEVINGHIKDSCIAYGTFTGQALYMAIEALKAQLSQEDATKDATSDTISRQAAIDAFGLSEKTRKYGGDHSGYDTMMLYEIQDILEGLPSAQPERGCWIAPKYYPTQFTFTCSKCGYKQSFNGKFKFCPNCGADMRGEQK